MGYLERVSKGKIIKPGIDTIYGSAGVGKSSWAAGAPDPFFIDIEAGTKKLDVVRMSPAPKSFMEVLECIQELLTAEHAYKTLVIDSLDHLEIMISDQTMIANRMKNRADFNSYARGYELNLEFWQRLVTSLKTLSEKMGVILICHSAIAQVNDPFREPYDRHDLKIHKKAAAFIVESSDSVFFAHKEPSKKDALVEPGKEKRKLYTTSTIAHQAKNRDNLPYELPLEYEDYIRAKRAGSPEPIETMIHKIKLRLELVKDSETLKKAQGHLEKVKGDPQELAKLLNRLEVLTSK